MSGEFHSSNPMASNEKIRKSFEVDSRNESIRWGASQSISEAIVPVPIKANQSYDPSLGGAILVHEGGRVREPHQTAHETYDKRMGRLPFVDEMLHNPRPKPKFFDKNSKGHPELLHKMGEVTRRPYPKLKDEKWPFFVKVDLSKSVGEIVNEHIKAIEDAKTIKEVEEPAIQQAREERVAGFLDLANKVC